MPTPKKDRIKKQQKRKAEAQADLEAITKAHAPRSARDEKKGLVAAVRKVIDAAAKRLHKLRHPHHETSTRAKIIAYCKWAVANEPSIHYAQTRPMPVNAPQHLPMYTDCSGFATLAYKVAGGPDPNGYGFNGYGFTGTLYSHCEKIPASKAKPGDLVEYGGYPGSHVVIYAGNGMCYSHGQEAGPLLISLAAEASAHAGQSVNYLRAL